MKNKEVVGVIGLPGSGKTEVVKYIEQKYGWAKVYFPEAVFDEIKKRGLEISEANERTIREWLREEYGERSFSTKAIEKISGIKQEYVLAESLYSWEEYL